jgi:hypothetical protein
MKSKGEELIINIIRKHYGNISIITQYSIGKKLTLDIYIPLLKLGIEYDGIQHFKKVDFFHKDYLDFLNQTKHDKIKNDLCKSLGICLVRFDYTDNDSIELMLLKILKDYEISKQQKLNTKSEYRKKQYDKLKAFRHKFTKKKAIRRREVQIYT